ncbi:MAG TPA: PHP domain-containing protein [Jiangellales bacterium]|nr:PHP domain-containing protein [Jiangellales bacterium]
MRIDLHTHSSVSDGTDPPEVLVANAAAADLDVIALTDHDTFDGWDAAISAGRDRGVTVVGGVEISTGLRGAAVHLLGYLPDPDFGPLVAELERIRAHRNGRLTAILERLNQIGVPVTRQDVLAVASRASSVGRPHVADALVARGYVANRGEAFDSWLAEGGPAFVPKYAPPTAEMIALVRRAGGVAVLAHPWGRSSRRVLTPGALEKLARAGLAGLEVDHDDHDRTDREELRALAADLGLIVTGSSDHHGTGKIGHELGRYTTDPEQYERLLDLVGRVPADASESNQAPESGGGAA